MGNTITQAERARILNRAKQLTGRRSANIRTLMAEFGISRSRAKSAVSRALLEQRHKQRRR